MYCYNYGVSSNIIETNKALHCTKFFHDGFLQQMLPNPQFPADLVTFNKEILNVKLHFFSSVISLIYDLKPHFSFIWVRSALFSTGSIPALVISFLSFLKKKLLIKSSLIVFFMLTVSEIMFSEWVQIWPSSFFACFSLVQTRGRPQRLKVFLPR